MKNGGGGAPENKLLKGKFLGFTLELFGFKKPILSCHPEDKARRISKKNRQEIRRFVQNDTFCSRLSGTRGSKKEMLKRVASDSKSSVILNLFQDQIRKSKKCHIDLPKQEGILRQEGRQSLSCTNHAQNDMAFKIETNFCHPEDEIRRISKNDTQAILHFVQNDKRCAFTLAEVLITLGVIGIVAAMTLPTVINNKRNKELETAFKRSYTVISQALNMYQAETGERLTSEDLGLHELKPILIKYMNVIEDCGWGTESNGSSCIPNLQDLEKTSKTYKNYNGTNTINLQLYDDGQFVLNDGSLILVENSGAIVNNQKRVFISVDVNGYNKNPNRLGQDLFIFQIDKKGNLLPMGANGTIYYSAYDAYCSPTSTSNMNGAGCTIKALSERDYFKNLPK